MIRTRFPLAAFVALSALSALACRRDEEVPPADSVAAAPAPAPAMVTTIETGRHIGAGAKKMCFHLFGKIFARRGIGQVQAIFVHQHLLMLEPRFPRFLGDVFINPPAEFPWIRREIEPLAFAAELYAVHCSCHIALCT